MILDELNDSQRKAVEYNGKHLLVLAGAGTGKTRTIIGRAAYLIKNGVDHSKIQILSFTRKSADEIVQRVNLNFTTEYRIKGSTFHSWCMDMIKKNPQIFEFHNYSIIDRDDQENIFRLICGRNKKTIEETSLTPKVFAEIYSYAINTRKNLTESIRKKLFNGKNDEETNSLIKSNKYLFETAIVKYEDYKKNRKYLDYDDLLSKVSLGLNNNTQAVNYLSAKIDHILVDEMQDTNPLQWELLSLFQHKCHLFCVGDDAQSIYSFRGADFRNVHLFEKRIPDSEIYKLDLNYRSTQEILDLSNWLLLKSSLSYNKQLIAIRDSGNRPVIMNFYNDWAESEWIAQKIYNDKINKSINFSENLILCRSSFGLRKLESFLLTKKIPYQIFGGSGLLHSAHIRDLLSALRIVSNIYDEIAWIRYLKLWNKIGDIKAAHIVDGILKLTNIEECINFVSDNVVENDSLVETLFAIKDCNNNPSEAVKLALSKMEHRFSELYANNWESKRKPDFAILVQLAKSKSSLQEFISDYILDPVFNESTITSSDNIDKVTLSTIHSAKGLESRICFILDVSPGSFPSKLAIGEGYEEIEEERRCLYVALTRAKDELIITRTMKATHTSGTQGILRQPQVPLDKLFEKMKIYDHKFGEGIITKIEKRDCYTYIHYKFFLGHSGNVLYNIFGSQYKIDEKGDLIRSDKTQIQEERPPQEERPKEMYFFDDLPENLAENKICDYNNFSEKNQIYDGEKVTYINSSIDLS